MAKTTKQSNKQAETVPTLIRLDKETHRKVTRKLFETNDRFQQNKQGNFSYANLCRILNEIWLEKPEIQAEVEKRFLAQ